MSQQQHPAPRPNRYLLPVMAAVTYLALVITSSGFLSLFLGRDVIVESDAGTILGPAMIATGTVATFVALVRVVDRRTPWVPALAAVTSVYLLMLAVAGVGYAWGRGALVWVLIYVSEQARSPFVIAWALLAGITVVALWAVSTRVPDDGRGIDR